MPSYNRNTPPIIEPDEDNVLTIEVSEINLRRIKSLMNDTEFQFGSYDEVVGWLLRMAHKHEPKARWWIDIDDLQAATL